MKRRIERIALMAVMAMMTSVHVCLAQQTTTGPVTQQYERGALWRALLGSNWRDVWNAPVTVPTLDLASFAGGLEPYKAGGNQTSTLHFHSGDGRSFVFRSVNKDVSKAVPKDMRGSPAGVIVQDQTSALHPTGALVVPALADALDILHVTPELVRLPDDARLGEYREKYANMVGTIELHPDDKDAATFANGAGDIVSSEKMIAQVEKSTHARIDARAYLKARLFDFIIGDTDRGADNWDWAEYKQAGTTSYRPFPRDRDYAFMRATGPVASVVTRVYPKLTHFRPEFPKLTSLEFMTTDFDRSHLVELSWPAWDSVVTYVQQHLTDDVIDHAVAALPASQGAQSADAIRAGLRARRDHLRPIAQDFYQMVSRNADVFASDDDERAEVDRDNDGSVLMRIFNQDDVVFERRFTPDITKEIRLYMERGNDRVVVRGNVPQSIQLRVTGGEGDDVLIDSGYVAHGDETRFYDQSGNNQLVAGRRTEISTTPFSMAQPMSSLDPEDAKKPEKNPRTIHEERRGRYQDLWVGEMADLQAKTQAAATRNWGGKTFILPFITYHDGPGIILGVGPTVTDYGFRRTPYEWQASVRALYGTTSGGFGVQLTTDRHFEVSPWSVSLFAHATQLESNRFFGYGNNTPYGKFGSTLIMRDEVLVTPRVNYAFGKKSSVSFGPNARWTKPHISTGSPADTAGVFGAGTFSQVGVGADVALLDAQRAPNRQSGADVRIGGSAYPGLLDVTTSFEEAHGDASFFVPLGRPTLAFRAGGKKLWGNFPLHEAAFIGAAESLRGYRWDRYAGDASAFGSAEVHLPIGRITLLTRGEFGLLAFSDAGRVWYKGASPGGWHTSKGGGISFGSMGQTASLTYAKGEEGRVYFTLGLPF